MKREAGTTDLIDGVTVEHTGLTRSVDMFLFRRHQARLQSERVASSESPSDVVATTVTTTVQAVPTVTSTDSHDGDEEEGTFMNHNNNSSSNRSTSRSQSALVVRTPSSLLSSSSSSGPPPRAVAMGDDTNEDRSDDEEEDDDMEDQSEGINRHSFRRNFTLADLEEERELARRRSSACLLFALFVLFRLWIFALQEGDFGLLLLCVMASSWTARWIRHNREQEEELDRRIANYIQNAENGGNGAEGGRHDNLRMLSFQAQLALAIMESQRQMMQGGYGHPDGEGHQNPGVSDEARAKWKKFEFKTLSRDQKESQRRGSYGSVAQGEAVAKPNNGDEEPHCSICLGEYEEGEELCTLPCGHVYHNDCIGSWCSNHTRCPLCNTDLETAANAAGTE